MNNNNIIQINHRYFVYRNQVLYYKINLLEKYHVDKDIV
jgi:hypothetical protein